MKATCDIIQDLLPLYCDNACSEESKKVVEAHIQECKQCRDDLSQMKKEIKREIPQIDKQKIAEKAKNVWSKKKRIAFIAGCLAVMLIAIISVGAVFAVHASNSVDGDDYEALVKYTTIKHANHVKGEPLFVKKAVKCVDHMAVIFQSEDGDWFMCVYDRDSLLPNRWISSVFYYNLEMASALEYSYHRNSNGEPEIFVFGIDVPEEVCTYHLEAGNITYITSVTDKIVLDVYVVADEYEQSERLVALDENGEVVYRSHPFDE